MAHIQPDTLDHRLDVLSMLFQIILISRKPVPLPIAELFSENGYSSAHLADTVCPAAIFSTLPKSTFDHPPFMTATLPTSMQMDTATSPPKAQHLKRVLSEGSNGSAPSGAAAGTPKAAEQALSPSSGGARTPKANGTPLKPDVTMAEETDTDTGVKKDGETLATDLDQLQVQSPVTFNGQLPGISQIVGAESIPARQPKTEQRQYSSSTEGSSSHPVVPSNFGSSYGSDGFPRTMTPSEETTPAYDPYLSVQAAAAVAAADEAIKQLNGTSTVVQGSTALPQVPPPDGPFQLPRGFASFVNPQARADRPFLDQHPSRQSSTSSNTTEASTSSEEEDLCIPSIEWVNLPNQPGSFQFTPYTPNAVPQQRMPPPQLATRFGNGAPHLDHRQTLPLGATAHTPSGLGRSSALPSDMPVDQPAEDDDDEQTVGQGRDRSSSSSSHSSQSGLDLLWRAANHGANQGVPSENYEQPPDAKGKRKAGAGADAIANWRKGGIPSGSRSAAERKGLAENGKAQPAPPKKRRRSEMAMDALAIDPSLRDEKDDNPYIYTDERYDDHDREPVYRDDDSDFNEDGEGRRPGGENSDDSSSGEDFGSGSGSDYGASTMKKKTGRSRSGRKVSMVRARASMGTSSKTPKKSRKSDPNASPASGRKSTGGGGGGGSSGAGVQCEYINPLPVSWGAGLILPSASLQILLCSTSCALPFSMKGDPNGGLG